MLHSICAWLGRVLLVWALLAPTAYAGTLYVDASGNGASSINSGSTNTSSPLTSGSAANWTSSTGSVAGVGGIVAVGSGYGNTLTGTMTWSGSGCSVNPVLNVTTNAAGQIATVNSVTTPGTCTTNPGYTATTWTAGGGLSAGSAAAFQVIMSQTINLDTNANLTGVITTPGPTQSSINLVNATNANSQTIFWINSVTGCTGSGSCSITVTQLVSCTTCTGNSWVVGGRYLFPTGSTVSALEGALGTSGGQDILQFNTGLVLSRTAAFITARQSGIVPIGSAFGGYIVVRGQPGATAPSLTLTGGNSTFNANNQTAWYFYNLNLTTSSTVNGVVQGAGTGTTLDTITAAAGSVGPCVFSSSDIRIFNSEFSGCTVGLQLQGRSIVVGNYIHGNSADGINFNLDANAGTFTVADNLITSNTGRGIYYSTINTFIGRMSIIDHNTIADNGAAGVEVASAGDTIIFRNNIVRTAAASINTVKWDAGAAEQFAFHSNNVIWQSNSSTSGVSGYTLNATETAADPQFVNSASGNYAIQNASPAANAGFPGVIGSSATTGYFDIGGFQRQNTGSGGGGSGGRCVGC